MSSLPKFKQIQYEFTAHIRNPDVNPKPSDAETRRMNIYNDLFYNNVESFISSGFPVLHELLDDDKWHRLIRDYFHTHKAKTPLFAQMPNEFVRYLEDERKEEEDDYPFMFELAHYEWAELAVSISDQEADMDAIDEQGDLYEGVPVLSPTAWALSYQYPVHKISPDFLPSEPGEQATFLIVYRNFEDDVKFMEINAITAHLIQMINDEQALTGKQMIQQMVEQLNHPEPDVVIQGGVQILNDLKERNIIIGVNKT